MEVQLHGAEECHDTTSSGSKCVISHLRARGDAWDSLEIVKTVCVHVALADASFLREGPGRGSAALAAGSVLT